MKRSEGCLGCYGRKIIIGSNKIKWNHWSIAWHRLDISTANCFPTSLTKANSIFCLVYFLPCWTVQFSLCESIRFRPTINVIDTYKFHRAKSKRARTKQKEEEEKDNTAIFIFIYKCALLPRTQMERNQKRAVTEMERREEKKINKRLSMWLYDCNIKRHTNWTVSRAPEAIPFECCAMRAITSLRYPHPDAMRNNFLSKSLIHIYKWVDQKRKT